MKRVFVWSVVALLSLMVAAQAKDDMSGGTEQAVAALEQKWIDAAKASNPDMLAPLLADKFINTSADSKVTGKKETLAAAKAAKWETSQISNVKTGQARESSMESRSTVMSAGLTPGSRCRAGNGNASPATALR